MNRKKLKKTLSILVGAALICGSTTVMAAENTSPESLTVGMSKDQSTITPFTYINGTPGFDVMRFIYDSLFTINEENEAEPWMVEKDYTISEDYKTYTVTLLDGIKWQDGEDVTPEDVKFTFEYVLTQDNGRWIGIASEVDSITVDGNQITFQLTDPDPDFIRSGLADMRIIAKHVYEGVEDGTSVESMGSGAYRMTAYEPDQYYTLEAFDEYFKGTPTVKTIQMPIISDASVMQQSLISGEIAAYTGSISPELIDTYTSAESINLIKTEGYVSSLLLFNCERTPFDEADFRTALTHAVDLDEIIDQVCLGYASKGTAGYVKEGLPEYTEGLDYVYDTQKAEEMLDALGYTEKDADGMRLDLKGEPMDLELLVQSGNTIRTRSAELISQQLGKIGVRVTVTALESGSVDDRVWPEFDVANGRDFDMAMWGWSAPVIQKAGAIVDTCYSDTVAGGDNLGGYRSEEFDALAEKYLSSSDVKEREQLSHEMQTLAAGDSPFMTLFYLDTISAVNSEMYAGWKDAKGTYAFNVFSFLPDDK